MSDVTRLTRIILAFYDALDAQRTYILTQAAAHSLDITLELEQLDAIRAAVRVIEKRLSAICKRDGFAADWERLEAMLTWDGLQPSIGGANA
jgi:hypothetical protein